MYRIKDFQYIIEVAHDYNYLILKHFHPPPIHTQRTRPISITTHFLLCPTWALGYFDLYGFVSL